MSHSELLKLAEAFFIHNAPVS